MTYTSVDQNSLAIHEEVTHEEQGKRTHVPDRSTDIGESTRGLWQLLGWDSKVVS